MIEKILNSSSDFSVFSAFSCFLAIHIQITKCNTLSIFFPVHSFSFCLLLSFLVLYFCKFTIHVIISLFFFLRKLKMIKVTQQLHSKWSFWKITNHCMLFVSNSIVWLNFFSCSFILIKENKKQRINNRIEFQ